MTKEKEQTRELMKQRRERRNQISTSIKGDINKEGGLIKFIEKHASNGQLIIYSAYTDEAGLAINDFLKSVPLKQDEVKYVEILKNAGIKIKALNFNGATITDHNLLKALECAPRLEWLDVDNCEELRVFKMSPGVSGKEACQEVLNRQLGFKGLYYQTRANLELTELVADIKIGQQTISKKLHNSEWCLGKGGIEVVETLEEMQKAGVKITYLNFSGISLNQELLQLIFGVCPDLEKLDLSDCRNEHLKSINLSGTKISELNIEGCSVENIYLSTDTQLQQLHCSNAQKQSLELRANGLQLVNPNYNDISESVREVIAKQREEINVQKVTNELLKVLPSSPLSLDDRASYGSEITKLDDNTLHARLSELLNYSPSSGISSVDQEVLNLSRLNLNEQNERQESPRSSIVSKSVKAVVSGEKRNTQDGSRGGDPMRQPWP